MNFMPMAARRILPAATICALSIAVVAGAAHAAPDGPDGPAGTAAAWPQAGFGPENSAYNATEPTLNASSVRTLRERWSATPPADGCIPVLPPVVADGRVFLTEGEGVAAYDSTTGRLLWRDGTAFSGDTGLHLAVAGDLLVAAAYGCHSVSDPDGYMTAFDTRTGARRWRVVRDAPFHEMVVHSGTVIVSGYSASDLRTVSAYQVSDGAHRWTRTGALLAAPVAAHRRLLLTEADGGSEAVAVATGEVLWRSTETWSVAAAGPTGDRFYVSTPARALVAVDASSGEPVWRVPDAAGTVFRPPATGPATTDGQRVYVADGNTIRAYRSADGRRVWRRDLGGRVGRPIRAGELLYAAVAGRPTAVLSPGSGSPVAPGTALPEASFHPVVVGGMLYAIDGRTLRAFRPAGGYGDGGR